MHPGRTSGSARPQASTAAPSPTAPPGAPLAAPLPAPKTPFARKEVFDDFCVYEGSIPMPVYQQGSPPYTDAGGDWAFDGSGAPVCIEHVQGGAFSPKTGLLYLSSDKGDAGGIFTLWVDDSRRRAYLLHRTPVAYHYTESTIAGHQLYYEELEGLTVWDLSDGRAPRLSGQLHLTMIDNVGSGDDDLYFKHFDAPAEREAAPGLAIGAFMRCDRGDTPTDHHTLFLAQLPPGPGFNHAAFEVEGLDDLMAGHEHLKRAGRTAAWGVGRHVLGSQIFDYWKDPWGHELEHWTDGDLFAAADGSRLSTMRELLDVQWGAPFPALAGKRAPKPETIGRLLALRLRFKALFRRKPKDIAA